MNFRLYVSRKVEGNELTNVEDYVNVSVQGLDDNIKKILVDC